MRPDLYATLDAAVPIFDGVGEDQLDGPTPCPNFDVRALINHALGVQTMGAAVLGEGTEIEDALGAHGSPSRALAAVSDQVRAAWDQEGVLDRTVQMPWGEAPASQSGRLVTTDLLIHLWDLARATGHDAELPEGPAAAGLGFMQSMLQPAMRSDGPDAPFGLEVPVADDAPLTDRLVAFSGRDPDWTP